MEKYYYLLVNFFTIVVPFIFSFHPRLRFWDNVKSFAPACLLASFLFLVWDAWFTAIGVWGFNERYVVGIYVFNMPLEEVLFFICIPYACVFSYHCFGVLMKDFSFVNTKIWSVLFVITSVVAVIAFNQQMYPFVNFMVFGILIVYLQWFLKPTWLPRFYFTYLIMVIPFFVVNGVLTGTGLDEPIVWYNPQEIIGVRMLTIPVEDTFYGMALIGLNILFYEGLLKRKANLIG